MIVKNEYVQIQVGDKTYTKKNMILNTYINAIFGNQISVNQNNPVRINSCYLKFDTPLENISYDSVLYASSFDVRIFTYSITMQELETIFKKTSIKNRNSVRVNYKFTNDGSYYPIGDNVKNMNEFSEFDGRKVTAIGFGFNNTCLAVIDVSTMNIMLNIGEEFVVSRVDTYQSDGVCNGIDYPLHLVNFTAFYDIQNNDGVVTQKCAELYSIGLGNREGAMESEQVIDLEDCEVGDNYITIPYNELIKVGHYPSENLFPGFYPTKDNSRYLILKYRLCRIQQYADKEYLDEYYTMSYPIDLSEYDGQTKDISFTLKLERM